ncbi:MAG: YajQ family cyclic di-GMP-binding protein [Chloroflexi bacterium]|nr:YajQ family cyclic di-GMP-binding protein [Chloroflexota bacterium]
MPSFDVVSKTDLMEVDNAVNGIQREIKQRFDLAGTKCAIDRTDNTLTMTADDTMKMGQLHELLRKYLARRSVDHRALDFKTPQNAAGDSIRQAIDIKQGIDADLGRKISKAVKASKLKVQIAIQGIELHVSAKQRDDLQATIEFIKEMDIEHPLQYVNFRD